MAIDKLAVINAMLASIGMTPLTANDTKHPRYIQANAKIEEIDSELQNRGWWFNRTKVTLLKNSDDEVPYPPNAVAVDPVDRTKNYVMRNGKLYDLKTATDVLKEDVKVYITYQLPFDELPPLAKNHLKASARHDFYLDQDGSEPKLTRYARLAAGTWEKLEAEHLKNADVNFFDGSHNIWFRTSYHPVNRLSARQAT